MKLAYISTTAKQRHGIIIQKTKHTMSEVFVDSLDNRALAYLSDSAAMPYFLAIMNASASPSLDISPTKDSSKYASTV